jgi:hypothetical protein
MISPKHKITLAILFIITSIIFLIFKSDFYYKHENNIAKEIGKFDNIYQVEFAFPTKNNNEFIISIKNEIWLLNVLENKIKITKDLFPLISWNGRLLGKVLADDSFYLMTSENGFLINPDLKIVRKDDFPDMNIGKPWMTPTGDFAAISHTSDEFGLGLTVVELPSKKIIQNYPDEFCIELIKAQDDLYLFTMDSKKDYEKDLIKYKVLIRSSPDWKIIKEISLGTKIHVLQDRIIYCEATDNQQGVVTIGTSDGRLIFLESPDLKVQTELKLSRHSILSMCKIDNRIIAVGDESGQMYLVDVRTHKVKKFPKISGDFAGYINAIAYQSSTKVLSEARGSIVRFWKLKEAAFSDKVQSASN